jgi:hypothetical protein
VLFPIDDAYLVGEARVGYGQVRAEARVDDNTNATVTTGGKNE